MRALISQMKKMNGYKGTLRTGSGGMLEICAADKAPGPDGYSMGFFPYILPDAERRPHKYH